LAALGALTRRGQDLSVAAEELGGNRPHGADHRGQQHDRARYPGRAQPVSEHQGREDWARRLPMRPPVPQSSPDSTRQRVEKDMKNRSCDEVEGVAEAGRRLLVPGPGGRRVA
ncbi:MAG TPA: hypothetical protein VHF26_21920, partial [Trebonia sp.]|nr:hypothetical protein [Trebonia sp.]